MHGEQDPLNQRAFGHIVNYVVNYTEDSSDPNPLVSLEDVGGPNKFRPIVPYPVCVPYTGGRVKALFIGINYRSTSRELTGCINCVRQTLAALHRFQFPIMECCTLVDDESFPNFTALPTRANIINRMAWLVHDARPGDVLFFHFSGRGALLKSRSGSRTTLVPSILPLKEKATGLRGNQIFHMLVKFLPVGVRMTAVFDCCDSPAPLALPFTFSGGRSMSYGNPNEMRCAHRNNFANADVILFTLCSSSIGGDGARDAKVHSDAVPSGVATQAFLWTLLHSIGDSFINSLKMAKELLREKSYGYNLHVSSTKPVNLDNHFSLVGPLAVDKRQLHLYRSLYPIPSALPRLTEASNDSSSEPILGVPLARRRTSERYPIALPGPFIRPPPQPQYVFPAVETQPVLI